MNRKPEKMLIENPVFSENDNDFYFVNKVPQTVYVVCRNDIPIYYCMSEVDAQNRIEQDMTREKVNQLVYSYDVKAINNKYILFRRQTEKTFTNGFGQHQEPLFNMTYYRINKN